MRINHCLFQYSPFNVSIMAILAVRSDLTVFHNSESQLPSFSVIPVKCLENFKIASVAAI